MPLQTKVPSRLAPGERDGDGYVSKAMSQKGGFPRSEALLDECSLWEERVCRQGTWDKLGREPR